MLSTAMRRDIIHVAILASLRRLVSALRLAQPLVGELGQDLDQELDPREEAVGLLRATLSWAARHQRAATRASSAPTVTALQRANGGLAPRPLLMQFPVQFCPLSQ